MCTGKCGAQFEHSDLLGVQARQAQDANVDGLLVLSLQNLEPFPVLV
jgi:hypothetical protein